MTLKIVSLQGEGLYKEKGSKFIAHVFYVENRASVDEKLAELASRYADARHICYAFRLGEHAETEFANDDGEPRNSAGQPILNQLRSAELTNVLGVVIRYFGGKKLGIGGLIQAYKEATLDAIDKCRTGKFEVFRTVEMQFPIASIGSIEVIGRKMNWKVIQSDFGEDCRFVVVIPDKKFDELIAFLDQESIEHREIKKAR